MQNHEYDDIDEDDEVILAKDLVNDIYTKVKEAIHKRRKNASSSENSTSHKEPPIKWKKLHARKMSNETDKMIDNEDCHHVLILAFCFSSVNEFKNFMYECGVVSIAGLKNERGQITNGQYGR